MTKQMTAAFDAAKGGSKRTAAMFAVLAAALALVMASSAPAFAQTTVEGQEVDWSPDSIEVAAGTSVTFNMVAGGAHNGQIVETGEEAFGLIAEGQSVSYTFAEEGNFTLRCTIHAGMDLAVTVTAGEDPAENGEDPAENGEDPAENGEDPAENGEDPAENGEDPAENGEDPADVEQPTAVESGTGGLVNTGLPMWVAALMALGALGLVAPAVAARRRS